MNKYEIYEAELEGVFINDAHEGFIISWDSDKGFGQFAFVKDKKINKFEIDNEMMTKEFIKAVLNKMVDDAELKSDKE